FRRRAVGAVNDDTQAVEAETRCDFPAEVIEVARTQRSRTPRVLLSTTLINFSATLVNSGDALINFRRPRRRFRLRRSRLRVIFRRSRLRVLFRSARAAVRL